MTRWLEGRSSPATASTRWPTGTIFSHELKRPIRAEAAARFTDIRHWSEPGLGGHFPALGKPDTFAAEIAVFSALVR